MEVISHSIQETKEIANQLAHKVKNGGVVALYGDLGSGKTTFTNYLVDALGVKARVQSPTFVIVRKYGASGLKINHVDLYRLTSIEEVLEIGIEELLADKNAVTVIEWPELAKRVLPDGTISIYFEYIDENTRKITL